MLRFFWAAKRNEDKLARVPRPNPLGDTKKRSTFMVKKKRTDKKKIVNMYSRKIRSVRKQVEEGRYLLYKANLFMSEYNTWLSETRKCVRKAMGGASSYGYQVVRDVYENKAFPKNLRESQLKKKIKSRLKNQITVLYDCIEQLENEMDYECKRRKG